MDSPGGLQPVSCELWLPRGPDLGCEVLSVRGSEALSRPFEFEIEIWCDDSEAPLASALGADAELLLERGGLERAIFGVIAELEVQLATPQRSERDGVGARLKLVPAFGLLAHEVDTRFFSGQSPIEILATLLGTRLAAYERSVDVESQITGTYAARDYCVQFRESTFSFCHRIMEEEGIAYFFVPDHDAQRERMVLVDANERYAAAELLIPGPIAVERDRPDELDRESVQGLDLRHAVATNRVVARGYNYKLGNPNAEGEATVLGDARPVDRTRVHDGLQRQIIDDPVADPEALAFDGSAIEQQVPLARRLLESLRVDAALGHGRSNAIGFAAGSTFELEQALGGGARALLLTRVVHHVRRSEGADDSRGYDYSNEFDCIPGDHVFRPLRQTPKPRVHGVQTGIVVGKKPDEIHTDRLGRVQVVFPMHDRDLQASSCWIRVAQVWAGQGFGAMVIPRVGMEVVVSFVDGDPDCPLITGCVYNGTNLPPYELPRELSKSTFKTSSTPGGEDYSELRIEDAKGSEQLFVRAQRRMDLRVQGTMYETCTGGHEATVGSPHDGPEPFTAIDARTILGDTHHFLQQDLRQQVCGKTSLVWQETLEASRGRRMTWVETEHQLTAPKIIREASDTISHKANHVSLSGSDTVSLMGGAKLILESNNAIELRVGSSFISLHQGGIDIHGFMLRLNSGGGVGHAPDAPSVPEFDVQLPFEALPADDGRGRGGGGGGGGGGGRSRDRGSLPMEPHSAPPMTPAKLKKPEHSINPIDATGTWIRMEWQQTEIWCSEPATLAFVVEGVAVGAHQSGFILDARGGELVAGFGVLAAADRFELDVSVSDILPRTLPDASVEASRDLNAQLSNGLFTPTPATLRFLTELPTLQYSESNGRFSIRVRDHQVVIDHLIPFVRGMMGRIISLGELADEDADGLIGEKRDGTKDWRYCKPITVQGNPDRLAYWDGVGWRIVPVEFREYNVLGDKLSGIALWHDDGELKTQCGKLPWPDPVREWAPESIAKLSHQIGSWSNAINAYWSGKFDLHREQCRGYDPKCCRLPIRCEVSFIEVQARGEHSIVIGENHARANAGAWPMNAPDRTAIHEFGHHLGNPDEYFGASTVDMYVNGDGAILGIDKQSIMGDGSTARRRHFETIAKACAQLVERETGKAYTFTPVEAQP